MKCTKVFVLLLIIVMNQCISSLETSSKLWSLHRKIKIRRNSGKSSTIFGFRTYRKNSTSKILKSQMKKNKALAQMKFIISAFLLGLNLGLKIANDVMSHFINKWNEETLDIMNQEKMHNQNTLEKMKIKEIESCATIKLIIRSQINFYLLTDFKSIFIKYYQIKLKDKSFVDKLNDYNKLILPKIKITVNNLLRIKKEIREFEADLLESLKEIEKDLCSQESDYIVFQNRNEYLEGKIDEMEKLIEEKEEGIIGTLLSGSKSSIITYLKENKKEEGEKLDEFIGNTGAETADSIEIIEMQNDLDEKGENGFGESIFAGSDEEKSFTFDISGITSLMGRAAETYGSFKELKKELEEFFKSKNPEPGGMYAKGFLFVASLCNLINQMFPSGAIAEIVPVIGPIFDIIGKSIEAFLAGWKLKHLPKGSPEYLKVRDQFYKALIGISVAIIGIAFAGFSGVVSEGLTFFKKIGDLISAYRRKVQQRIELNYYKTLADLKINDQENTINFKICLANLLSMRSQFKTILNLATGEEALSSSLSKSGEQMIKELFSKDDSGIKFYNNHALPLLKKEVEKICKINLQFCSRNFDKKFLNNLNFGENEINKMVNDSIYGPYTDIVVSIDEKTSIDFLKLGYEPIAETIYGCRMCSPDTVIRHFKIISDSQKDDDIREERKNLILGKISEKLIGNHLYGDDPKEENKDYSQYRVLRLDTKYYIFYEDIKTTKTRLALSRLLYYPKKILDGGDDWMPNYQAELSYWGTDKIWHICKNCDKKNNNKKECMKCGRIYPQEKDKPDDFSIIITNHKQIIKHDHIYITRHSQYELNENVPIGNNLLLFPQEDIHKFVQNEKKNLKYKDDKILTYLEYQLREGGTIQSLGKSFIYHYESAREEKSEVSFGCNNLELLVNNYNWIIKSDKINSRVLSQAMENYSNKINWQLLSINMFLNNNGAKKEFGEINPPGISYYLFNFEPFSNKSSVKLSDQELNPNCESVCKTNNDPQEKISCPTFDLSFNSWRDSLKKLPIVVWNPNTTLLKGSEGKIQYQSGDKTFYEFNGNKITIEQTQINYTHFKLPVIPNNNDDDDNLLLLIEKTYNAKKYKYSLKLSLIKSSNITKYIDENEKQIFKIKLQDIDENIYVVTTRDKSDVKKYFETNFQDKGYIIVKNSILKGDDFMFVMIKPLPSSNILPQIDIFKPLAINYTKELCVDTIYGKFSKNLFFLDHPISTYYAEYILFSKRDDENKVTYYEFFLNHLVSSNETKVMNAKYNNYEVKLNEKINLTTLFQNNFKEVFDYCSPKEFLISVPIRIKFDDKNQKENLYRVLEVDKVDGTIKPMLSSKGPGIKSTIWLSISTKNHETEIDKISVENMKLSLSSGYSFYKDVKWLYYNNQYLYVRIFVNFDFRLKIDKQEICDLCNKVKEKFQKPPSYNMETDLTEIIKYYHDRT